MIKNKFFYEVQESESRGASKEELSQLLGRGRSRKGIFEGNLDEGELEIGQVSALIKDIKPVSEIFNDIIMEFNSTRISLLEDNWILKN